MADAELAQSKGPVKMASADEIRRVLKAATDYDCLQVSNTIVEVNTSRFETRWFMFVVGLKHSNCMLGSKAQLGLYNGNQLSLMS